MSKLKASAKKTPVIEIKRKPPQGAIASHMREVLIELGEDPAREGLANTPQRVEKALHYLTSGYSANLDQIVNGALFDVKYDEVVIVRDIEFFSMCEHHMLPFFGKIHVAYLPDKKVIGLSKLPRIRAAPANPRKADAGSGRNAAESDSTERRCGDLRSAAFLHDDARRGETAFGSHH
jgi:GTP cyclohydrolase I